jgi:hypothetical protein
MKFSKQAIFIIFAIAFQFKVHAQDKKACDSLVGKSFDFLADEADEIFLGKIYQAHHWKSVSEYIVNPIFSYKGQIQKRLEFSQNQNPKFFDFREDSIFIFLSFNDYQDKIFSSCFLFGKKANMTALLKLTGELCEPYETPRSNPCERINDPVCGCDGIEYGNQCEARNSGIEKWVAGPCKVHFCKPKHPPILDRSCLKNLQPVCGCDGKTYGNSCSAESNGIYNFVNSECK